MVFAEHAKSFGGKRVVEYDPEKPLPDPAQTIPRLVIEYDAAQTMLELFSRLLDDPKADQLTGLVIGRWSPETFEDAPDELVEALVAAAPRLPNLRALFFGDITFEECEVSWLQLGDLSPLWEAFPQLEELRIRGANGLELGEIEHRHLKSFTLECGGLGRDVLQSIVSAKLPELEKLLVYLGDSGYGWDGTLEDVMPLLGGELFPKLKYLGLCDSEIADEIAVAAANAPILNRLETLDLSQGTLGDEGAAALLASSAIRQLKKLDLTHHFISDEMQAQLKALPLEVILDEPQSRDEDDFRYVAVGE